MSRRIGIVKQRIFDTLNAILNSLDDNVLIEASMHSYAIIHRVNYLLNNICIFPGYVNDIER
jgi:hypothetical protein